MDMNLQSLLLFLFISIVSFRSDALSIYTNPEQKNDDTNIISDDGTDKDVMWLYEELDENTRGLNAHNICNYFDVYSNQLKIDCNSLIFVLKPRAVEQNHLIHKRDIENETGAFVDGGSGDGENSTPLIEASSESPPPPPVVEVQSTIIDDFSSTNAESTTETETAPTEANKKARKFNPSADPPKEVEEVNPHQNNISNTLQPNEIVEDEKQIEKMNKSANAGEPNPGESAENTVKASKDTKILIVLFVAVVIIGVGAFLYNFIKKKRQGAPITTENSNGPASRNEDPERGQEMKPLMKGKIENGDNPKREDKIVENDEKNEKVAV